jgi:hypothetical protein
MIQVLPKVRSAGWLGRHFTGLPIPKCADRDPIADRKLPLSETQSGSTAKTRHTLCAMGGRVHTNELSPEDP